MYAKGSGSGGSFCADGLVPDGGFDFAWFAIVFLRYLSDLVAGIKQLIDCCRWNACASNDRLTKCDSRIYRHTLWSFGVSIFRDKRIQSNYTFSWSLLDAL